MKYEAKQEGDKIILGFNEFFITICVHTGEFIEKERFARIATYTFDSKSGKYIVENSVYKVPREIDSIADIQKWCLYHELK